MNLIIGGFIIIDKPKGWTSFDVIRKLRQITGIRKIGHGGVLDVLASGVLVVGLGNATKLLSKYLKGDKEYSADILFGAQSATYDLEGSINFTNNEVSLKLEQITSALKDFMGIIMQKPPVFSALKIQGKRASDIVRHGGNVELKLRQVTIVSLDITAFEPRFHFVYKGITNDLPLLSLQVVCSHGTYIRSLAHDLGENLGVGAVLYNLRRLRVAEFSINQAVRMEDLNAEHWLKYMIKL